MGRGRGGARGGGRGGRGGKRGGSDAASSGEVEGASTPSKRGRGGKRGGGSAQVEVEPSTASMKRASRHEDMYDEVDDFMENKHRIGLSGVDHDDDEDEADQAEGQSFELEGLEPESEEDDYEEVEAKEAEEFRQKDLRQEANVSKGWGKKKKDYYDADTRDFEVESDDEIAAAEEKEGKRLQIELTEQLEGDVDDADNMMAMVADEEEQLKEAKDAASGKKKSKKVKADSTDAELLRAMDDDLDNIHMALDMDMDLDILGGAEEPIAAAKQTKSKSKKKQVATSQSMLVEKIAKDVSALSETAKLESLLTSSPELMDLLDDFKARMVELREALPQWEAIKDHQTDANTAKYCYLSLKVESLLMYCCHLSFYFSMKAEGDKNTQQHPIMKTLLHLRQTLEQLKPMDDHFANFVGYDEEDDEDADLDEAEDEEEGLEADDGEEDMEDQEMDDMEDGGEDFGDEDEGDFDLPPVDPSNLAHSDLMSRQASQLDRLLAGVNQPKKSKKALAASGKASAARSALSDYGETDHRAEMARNITIGKASGKLAALEVKVAQAREDQKAAARKKRSAGDGDEDGADAEDETGGWARGGAAKKAKTAEAGEAYEKLKTKKQLAKEARKKSFAPSIASDPSTWAPALGENDHRKVNRLIDANRGLVRARDKQLKTPKTRNRSRWEKRQVARNGQVQTFKGSQAANYGGQATGIKTTVTKSIKLG